MGDKTGNRNSACYSCSTPISGKKSHECNDCSEYYCKDHVKINEISHSTTCTDCFKKKIFLEVSMEMENQVLEAKTQLNTVKEKLKNCKKDLANKAATLERLESQIKINEKSYQRRFENNEKKIEEEIKRAESIFHTAESLQIALKDCNANEKGTELKLEKAQADYNDTQTEVDTLKEENQKLKVEIQLNTEKMKGFIPYSRIRGTLCSACKQKVKLNLREEILNGNQGRDSLIASVLQDKERFSARKSMNTQISESKKPADSCNKCIIF